MVDAKALHDLEWDRLVEAVLSRCEGPMASAREIPLATTAEGTARGLLETGEAMSLLEAGEPLPVSGIPDVRESLDRVARQGALTGAALRDVLRMLETSRRLRKFLGARKETSPALFSACACDPTLDRLLEELAAHVGADGVLFDHASAELRRLRTETANLRARMVAKLERILQQKAAILSDTFYTIREGRYVVPVRRDAHERFEGIVHATSQSGATIFVEPRSLIAQGNRLKMAQAEQEREESRILGLLSELVAERLAEIRAAADALDHADLRAASAKLGRDLDGRVIELLDTPTIRLRGARHPLLLLDEVTVVPNDLPLEEGRALVLSGPNAGGKTVALKTIGLCALMMRAGLPFPAEEGSGAGFFDQVLTDVGDDQSTQRNLSTFSAHITNIASILKRARRGSLVLLDELSGGTDPGEGAALACALVDSLCGASAATAVTTHYEPLKAMATSDERLQNAAVGFDVAKMEPTFELTLDVPGASSALAVAERFGIPHAVIARATEILPEQSKTFEDLVRQLGEAKARARERFEEAERERELARELGRRAQEDLERLRERADRKVGEEAEQLLAQVRSAREELKKARRQLREAENARQIEEARARVSKANEAAADARAAVRDDGGEPSEPLSVVSVGDRVYVPRLRAEAEVIEGPAKERVRVSAGAMKLWVGIDELAKPPERPEKSSRRKRDGSKPAPRKGRVKTIDNTLDVRGLRVDEAISMAEAFLDRMYGADQSTAFIVHGVGTGALKEAIRELLGRREQYVRSVRGGTLEEGGERLTVVELR